MKRISTQPALMLTASLLGCALLPSLAFAQGGSLGGSNIEMCQSGAINCGYPASHKSDKSEKPQEKEPKAETTKQESAKLKGSASKVAVNEH